MPTMTEYILISIPFAVIIILTLLVRERPPQPTYEPLELTDVIKEEPKPEPPKEPPKSKLEQEAKG